MHILNIMNPSQSLPWLGTTTLPFKSKTIAEMELRSLKYTARFHPSTGLYDWKSILVCANDATPPIGQTAQNDTHAVQTSESHPPRVGTITHLLSAMTEADHTGVTVILLRGKYPPAATCIMATL